MSLTRSSLALAAVWATVLPSARGGRGESLRKVPAPGVARSASAEAVVVALERLPARPGRDGVSRGDASFYVGNITVGEPPQHLTVLFDTGSGQVLLPHKACRNRSCLEHHQYSPWASSTALDVNHDGTPVQAGNRVAQGPVNRSFATLEFTQGDLGDGVAKGVLVRDHVCLSAGPTDHSAHRACADLAMLAATQEDAMPFEAMPADGIIGLGLSGLSVSALSSFYSRLMEGAHGLLPEFGMALGSTGGQIIFGGRAAVDGFAAPLEWFPVVHADMGFWQIEITRVRVGGVIVDRCLHGCHAIIDTGSSHLGVQANRRDQVMRELQFTRSSNGQCQGPDLQLDLTRGLSLAISAADYSDAECDVRLGPLNLEEPQFMGIYSLGTNVIRRYYTAFDWEGARVGFAPNPGSPPLTSITGISIPDNGSVPADLIVL